MQIKQHINFKGVLYAILSSATFGLVPLFSLPLLDAGLCLPEIIFYRLGLAAVIMGLVILVLRRNFRIAVADIGIIVVLSCLYAATSLVLLMSYNYIPSGMATTIHFLYPLVVTLVMTLLFKDRSSLWLFVAVGISLLGVTMLSWGGTSSNQASHGIALALVTVITYASYIVGIMKSRASRIDSLVLAFYVMSFGAIYLLIYTLFSTGVTVPHDSSIWRSLLLLALIPTVISNLTLVMAIKEIGSTMTSILGSMEPLTAVLVGVLHFGETFTFGSALGLILVIAAVVIVILQSQHRTPISQHV